jgi:hypothetical protein
MLFPFEDEQTYDAVHELGGGAQRLVSPKWRCMRCMVRQRGKHDGNKIAMPTEGAPALLCAAI